jgi:spore germination cell wall hydrolase CwlJ-like protein
MTEVAIERGMEETVQVSHSILKFISLSLMAFMLWAAINLLTWAVNTRLANTEVAETSTITAQFRERQLSCLAKNIYHEAGSEPFEGKIAVAQVTMNRVASGKFPDDVCQTIYQKNVIYEKVICQFSWACDRVGKFTPTNSDNYKESMIAAQKVLLENYRLPSLEKAMFYHADYIDPRWGKEKVAKIGHHIFYK